jgi:hypothetical protein
VRKTIKLLVLLLVSTLISSLATAIKPATAESTPVVMVDPSPIEYYLNAVGKELTVAVKVVNVTDLYGIDITFRWNTTFLEYVSHSVLVPKNTYTDGILYNPTLLLADQVNATGGTYWIAYTSLSPAPSFNGTGTAFTMTFRVKYHPRQPEPTANIALELYSTDLAGTGGMPISHTKQDGSVILYSLPPVYTMLYVANEGQTNFRKSQGVVFTVDVAVDNVTDLYGFSVSLYYNTTLLDAVSTAEGSFLNSQGDTWVVKDYVNDTEGHVRYAVTLLGAPSGVNGSGTLFTVTFRATTTTVGTSNLTLQNTDLGDYNADTIDHAVMDGSVTILLVEKRVWISDGFAFATASSSTILDFAYNHSQRIVTLDLTGPTDIPGYTDLTVPKTAMTLDANDMFIVLINGTAEAHIRTENSSHYFLYFEYTHATYRINILQTLIGDLNGDRAVDIVDVVTICVAFDSTPDLSYWNPVADLKSNGQIDIFDVIMLTRNYDKTWTVPP